MSKKAEIRRRRHERRGRNRTVVWTLVGIVALIAVGGIVASIIAANRCKTVENPETITTDSGLEYRITEECSGPKPEAGDQVLVQYRGTFEDGTEFDSGEIPFTLGTASVIPGWDEGIALLSEGSSASFVIPPELGYGPDDYNDIPGGSTLYFDVTLVDITPAQ